jgi:DNA-binding CsgD family transcriptional regulator
MNKSLSDREQDVLNYAVKGFTDDQIAQVLGIEKGTVNSYWVRIRGKLGHLSRTHLVANYLMTRAEDDRNKLAHEQTRHAEEIAESSRATKQLIQRHQQVMEDAQLEIERLKSLLRKKTEQK